MAVTQAQLDKLERAYYSGATRVSYDGKGYVEFRSLNDMASMIAQARAELGLPAITTTAAANRTSVVRHSRGD